MDIEKSRVYDKRRLLKIKLKSLREEVKIIRAEEVQLASAVRKGSEGAALMVAEMARHRRWDLRMEARATLLAYGFIRGKKYGQIEPRAHCEKTDIMKWRIERVAKMVGKYGRSEWRGASPEALQTLIRDWMGIDKNYVSVTKAA